MRGLRRRTAGRAKAPAGLGGSDRASWVERRRAPASGGPAMSVLVTGTAGFIGFHVAQQLMERGCSVIGIDDLNGYYDPALKQARLACLSGRHGFTFRRHDVQAPHAVPPTAGRLPRPDTRGVGENG